MALLTSIHARFKSVHASQQAMSPAVVVVMLSLLLGIQPIATDLYLPALPSITAGFGASMAQAQLTLTGMLLAFGLSQLVWGPLSDRFGRRPILLVGLSAYAVSALAGVFSSNMEQLIVWRMVQGASMGAAVMCARAVVRDLYAPAEGARVMSKGLTGLGVIACASAPLGGVMAEYLGWRMALAALAVFGASAFGLVALYFRETLSQKNPQALQPLAMLTIWRGIVRHPTFWTYALLSMVSYLGLFTFLASSSFVFIGVLGLSKTGYGLVMLCMTLSYIAGTFGCRHLLARLGVRRTVAVAGAFSLLGGTAMGVLALLGYQGVGVILGPFVPFMLAHGVHQPCGQSGAVAPFPQAAGAASALSGCLMMVAAFGMGSWLGTQLGAGASASVLPLTNGIWLWSVAIATVAWTLVQRHGEVKSPPQRHA